MKLYRFKESKVPITYWDSNEQVVIPKNTMKTNEGILGF